MKRNPKYIETTIDALIIEVLEDQDHMDALVEHEILDIIDDKYDLGLKAEVFAEKMFEKMVDHAIEAHGIKPDTRERHITWMIDLAPKLFEQIYRDNEGDLDHRHVNWSGPLMLIFLLANAAQSTVGLCAITSFFEGAAGAFRASVDPKMH